MSRHIYLPFYLCNLCTSRILSLRFNVSAMIIIDIYICKIKIHVLCLEIYEYGKYRKCSTAEAMKDGRGA